MPVFRNGKHAGAGKAPSAEEIIKRILGAIRESGKVGDLSRFSAEDMKYVKLALSRIAEESVTRIFVTDLLDGVNMDKVIDVYEVARHHHVEI